MRYNERLKLDAIVSQLSSIIWVLEPADHALAMELRDAVRELMRLSIPSREHGRERLLRRRMQQAGMEQSDDRGGPLMLPAPER